MGQGNGRITLAVLGERIDQHNKVLLRHIEENSSQHAALKAQFGELNGKLSLGLKGAHRRIDKIWWTAFTCSTGIIATLIGALVYVLYAGPPWQ